MVKRAGYRDSTSAAANPSAASTRTDSACPSNAAVPSSASDATCEADFEHESAHETGQQQHSTTSEASCCGQRGDSTAVPGIKTSMQRRPAAYQDADVDTSSATSENDALLVSDESRSEQV